MVVDYLLSGGKWAICYYNSSKDPIQVHATWKNMYFMDRSKPYAVRDVWQAKDLGTTASPAEVELTVPPVDVILLVLTPVK